MMFTLIFALLFSGMFFLLDILQKKVFTGRAWSRKATHVLSGLLVIPMPEYLGRGQIIFLAGCFLLLLLVSRWKQILSIHEVDRFTIGEILYPISIGILALMCLPEDPAAFRVSTLLLAFSDGFAGIFGELLNFKPIKLGKNTKSIGGSLTFLLTSLGILLIFHGFSVDTIVLYSAVAIGLTLLEFFMIYGFDNLTVPVASALVELYLLG
ncbi:MAG: hypothetical protein JW801_07550 [Bacteroidales bacterium]|nr:hypothetical protein [Bacteroidales bacterium]